MVLLEASSHSTTSINWALGLSRSRIPILFSISFVLTEASVAPSLYAQGRGFVQGSEFRPTTSADIRKGVIIKVMIEAQRRCSRKASACRLTVLAIAWAAILYAGTIRSSAQPNK